MNRLMRSLITIGMAAFLLAFAGTAHAQKVVNPGTFNFKLTNGVMQVKDQVFSFDESQNINFNGSVTAAGDLSIPSITFPDYPVAAGGFNLTVKINVVGPTTGTINPLNGAVSLRLRVWIKIDGVPLGGGCRIANAASPIDVNVLTSGTSGSRTGSPYSSTTGTTRIVNSTFAVPTSSDCGLAAGTVNDTVGIPSGAGNNGADFSFKTTPNANPAIAPVLNASPLTGTAPFTTTLSAAGSNVVKTPATYRWDFTNDGTIDATTSVPTVNHTYTVGGTPTARVQIADADGDVAQVTRQLTVNAFPDMGIAVSHDSDFRVGTPASYKVALTNHGYAATSGPLAVTSTLPEGLSYSGVTGGGWNCSANGQDLSCSRSGAIAVGASAPELGINVAVAAAAKGEIEPSFTVNTAGDNGPGNNTATDLTRVRATDLKLSLSHESHAMLLGSDPANLIKFSAENIGDADTAGPSVVVNDLPAGLTPLSADGQGWTCDIVSQKVTCTHAGAIAAGERTSEVTVQVEAALEPEALGTTVDNVATLTTPDDVDLTNNTVTDPTLILNGHDIGITKSHDETFTAGQNEKYKLAVKNFGLQATTGPITVTDELPEGLSFVSADGGPDWECVEEDGTVTCEHAGPVAAGADAADIELTVSVGVAAIPEVTNSAAVETADDPNPANDSSSDTAVVQAIDLTIEKSHEGLIRVGREAVYKLAVRNVGDSPTTSSATVTDSLPAGLEFVSVDGGTEWDCSEASGTVICEYADVLVANQQAPDIELTTIVGPAAAPEVSNTATVSTQDDFNSSNDESLDEAVVIDVDTAASILRTGTFRPGHTGTYLLVAKNEGTVATVNPTEATIELPTGLEFDSVNGAGWTCGEEEGKVTCTYPAGLAAGASAPAISLRVQVSTLAVPEVETELVVKTEGDRYPDNDTASNQATVVAPDLTTSSSHEGSFRIGSNHSYFLEVENLGNGPTVGAVTLTDTLPAGFTAAAAFGPGWSCAIASTEVTCQRTATLPAGGSTPAVRIDVTPAASALPTEETSATVDNQAEVNTPFDSDSTNDSTSDPTELIAVDLGIAISGPADVAVGEIAEYAIEVENLGSAATEGAIRVVDTLPGGFSPRSSNGQGWTCSSAGRKVTCDYSLSVEPATKAPTLTIRGRAGSGAIGVATNQATVSTTGDVVPGNNSSELNTEVTAAADLELKFKSSSPNGTKIVVGTDSGYLATVTNRGTAANSEPIHARITLPAGLTFLSQDSGAGWNCSAVGSTVNCEFNGSLEPGATSSFGIRVEVARSVSDGVSVNASLVAGTDSNPENDTANAIDQVAKRDLSLTRIQGPEWVRGSTGSYQLKVTNEGSLQTAGPITMTEVLPTGASFASSTGEGWNCAVSKRTLTCIHPDVLNPGDSSELGITLNLGAGVSSSIDARSQISTNGDSNPENDTAAEVISVGSTPAPSGSDPVTLRKGNTPVSGDGRLTIWVSCPASSANRCVGSLNVRTTGKVKVNRRKKARINLGKATFSVAPGRTLPVRVNLNKRARKAVGFNRKIKAKVVASNPGKASSRAVIVVRKAR